MYIYNFHKLFLASYYYMKRNIKLFGCINHINLTKYRYLYFYIVKKMSLHF